MAKVKTNNREASPAGLIITGTLILICLSYLSYNDNSLWKSETSLWANVSEKSPFKPRPLTNAGYAYYKDKNYREAENYLKKAIKQNPLYYIAYTNLGLLYKDTNRLIEAEGVFKKSISIVNNPTVRNALGTVYRKLSNSKDSVDSKNSYIDSAIKQYNLALALKPNYTEALNNLANAYYIKGDLQNSIIAFKKAININPYIDEVHNNLGLIYQQNKNYREAENSFLNALGVNNKNFKTYINLGTLSFIEKNYDQALTNYLEAVKIKPDYSDGYYNIGVTYETKGKTDKAREYYKKALQINPSHSRAIKRLEKLK